LICTLSSAKISGGVGGRGGINKWNQAFRQFSLQIHSIFYNILFYSIAYFPPNSISTTTTNLMIETLKGANSIIAVLSFPKSYMYMTLTKECALLLCNGLLSILLSCGHLYTNMMFILQSVCGSCS
jgi:hypothetical protein